jgi:hypothetical protein
VDKIIKGEQKWKKEPQTKIQIMGL